MNVLDRLIIQTDASIRTAMQAITANGREVVLVRDADGLIVGLITDGDIRRGLLRGLTLESLAQDVMTRDFVAVSPTANRAVVLDLMRSRAIQHVPVLDSERRFVAIHFLTALIGTEPKPNAAIIMAGGKGTRLGHLTKTTPKPMMQVAGRPILERIVLHLVGYGIQHIFLAVNFLADQIEGYFGDGSAFGCRIQYLREKIPLGTGGALALLPKTIDYPVLVLNGDQITQIDVSRLLETHIRDRSIATMAVGPHQIEIPFATVTAQGRRLVSLEEKPTLSFLINRGIYALNPEALSLVPSDKEFAITDLFAQLVCDDKPVGVYYTEDEWIDVGRPDDLRRARGDISR